MDQNKLSSISNKRLIALFAVVAVVICAIGAGVYRLEAGAIKAREIGRLEAITSLKANQVQEWIRERRGDAKVLAATGVSGAAIARVVNAPTPADVQDLWIRLDAVRNSYGYAGIELFDSGGKRHLFVGAAFHETLELHPQVLTALATSEEPYLVDFAKDEMPGETHELSFAVGIHDDLAEGRPLIGVIVLNIDPNTYLFPLIQSWPIPSASAEALLVRREGDEVVFLNTLRHLNLPPMSLRIPVTRTEVPAVQAVLSSKMIFEGRDYRGRDVLAASQRVDGTSWSVVAKVDSDEVFESLRSLAWTTTAVVLLVIFAAAAILVMIFRQHRLSEEIRSAQREGVFREILDHSADAVFICDRNGRYLYTNAEAGELLGYSSGELLALSIADVTPPEDAAHSRSACEVRPSAPEDLRWRLCRRPIEEEILSIWYFST